MIDQAEIVTIELLNLGLILADSKPYSVTCTSGANVDLPAYVRKHLLAAEHNVVNGKNVTVRSYD